MIKNIIYLFIIITTIGRSQSTNIPNVGFEEDLIYQNIDSDGVVNGQVFTDDISALTSYAFSGFFYVTNIVGISDFSELISLNLTYTNIGENEVNFSSELSFSDNTKLQELILIGDNDNIDNSIVRIDLSANQFINNIILPGNWLLKELDLKSGNIDNSNVNINIDIDPGFNQIFDNPNFPENFNDDFCIKVTNEAQATAGQGVYATWTISADNNPYYFSETCTLSTERFTKKEVSVYPNPAYNELYIESQNFNIENISIYDMNGQLVVKQQLHNRKFDISYLNSGVYILSIETDKGVIKKKVVKL